MKLQPLYDRVIVRRDEETAQTTGGLYIPENAKEKTCSGTVVAAGTGNPNRTAAFAMLVKEGDKILFGKYAGSEINFEGEELIIMKEDEILAIIPEKSLDEQIEETAQEIGGEIMQSYTAKPE